MTSPVEAPGRAVLRRHRLVRRYRLVPVAVAAWAGAGIATTAPAWPLPLAIGGWAAAGVLLAAVAAWRRRAGATALVAAVLAAAALGAAATGVAATAHERAAAEEVAAGRRALIVAATVAGKVEGDDGIRFGALATSLSAGPRQAAGGVPVTVSADRSAVTGGVLDVGAEVLISGTAFTAEPGERAVLVVEARTVEVVAPPTGVLAVTSSLRRGLVAATEGLPGPGAGLVPGLAVGDTSAVSADLDAAMTTSSLAHLTAVSGANCALVVAGGFGLVSLAGLRRGLRVAAGVTALAGFVALVTPEASVVRAAAMSGAAMLALLLGRRRSGIAVLCLGATACLVADPWLAGSLGFALSVAATSALLVLAPPLAAGLARWMPRALALALAVPLSAQLVCGPLLLTVDPAVPVYGVVANLLAAPAAPVATVVGLLACLAAPVPVLQAGLAALAWLPASWIAATAAVTSALPGARAPWLPGAVGIVLLALVGGAIAIVVARPSGRVGGAATRVAAAAVALAAGVAAGVAALGSVAAPLTMPADWAVVACDVGQGDAFVVRSAGATALVDTGPDPALLERCLARSATGRVDLVVLTHFDLDHRGGLPALLGRVAVLLHGPAASPPDVALLERFRAAGTTVVEASAGMSGRLGEAAWRVLWPRAGSRAFAPGNDASVVVDIRGGGVPRALFLGDLSASPQRALLASGRLAPPYDIVKVAHHGSADQADELYAALGARVALVSAGLGNDYGHPRREALDLVAGLGMTVARTDRDGVIAVAVTDDGLAVWQERVEDAAARAPPGRDGGDGRRSPTRCSRRRRVRDAVLSHAPATLSGMAAPRSSARGPAKRPAIPQISWRAPQPAPVVLVSGPEEVCAERAIAGIRDYLKAEDPSVEVSDVRADDYAPGTLLAVTSPSLFGEPRLVRVAGVEKASDAFLAEALSYLDAPQEGATVVLRHTGASVRGKKLLDAIRAGTGGGVEIPCAAIKRDSDRFDFAADEFREARRRIAPAALRALVSAFADDLTELAAACQQLIADVPGDIDERTVERYYGGRVETSAFTVADTAIAGRHGDALVALRQALGSGADPVPLVAAVAMKLRTMARVAGSREPSTALAARLGMKDWQVDRARRDLVGWSDATLGLAIQATARADAEVKGASRDPVFALERMLTVIATKAPYGV